MLSHRHKKRTFAQIPHPIHKSSEMNAILSEGVTSIQSLPLNKNTSLSKVIHTKYNVMYAQYV